MRATVAAPGRRRCAIQFSEPPHNTSLRVQAKKPPVLGGVVGAIEEAPRVERCSPDERSDIRERLPRISLRSCGLRLPVPGRRRRAIGFSGLLHTTSLMLIGVARMSSAISGKDCPAYRFAHAGYGCFAGATSTRDRIFRAAAPRVIDVDRCSPDERSDIRERRPRISLRSCGLRLPVPGRRRRAIGFSVLLHTTSLMLSGVARMSEAIPGKDCPAYRCAHAGYGCLCRDGVDA
jgi:hypothetical protein